jgi:hypothetical protein
MGKHKTPEEARRKAKRAMIKSVVVCNLLYSTYIVFAMLDGESVFWRRFHFIACAYLWPAALFFLLIACLLAFLVSKNEYLDSLKSQIADKDIKFCNGLVYSTTLTAYRSETVKWLLKVNHILFIIPAFIITGSKSLLFSFIIYRASLAWAVSSLHTMMEGMQDVVKTRIAEHEEAEAEKRRERDRKIDEKLANIGSQIAQEENLLDLISSDE